MKKHAVKQQDIADCGPACLASVSSYYGRRSSIASIRQLAHTGTGGTNVSGLLEGASAMGFDARGVKGSAECLPSLSLPAIAHWVKADGLHHFVVIFSVEADCLEIMDPAGGYFKNYSTAEFNTLWSGILILLTPNDAFKKMPSSPAPPALLWNLLRQHKRPLMIILAGALIYSFLGLMVSFYVKKIVDDVILIRGKELIFRIIFSMCSLHIVKVLVEYWKNRFSLVISQKIDENLVLGYYHHLLTLPQAFFDSMKTGELLSRINDAVKIRELMAGVWVQQTVNTLIIIISLGCMICFSWKLTGLIAICLPFFFLLFSWYNQKNRKYLRESMENAAVLESHWVESLNLQKTVRYFNLEERIRKLSGMKFNKLLKSNYNTAMCSFKTQIGMESIHGVAIIAVLGYGAHLVLEDHISPGTLVSFYSLTLYLMQPMKELIRADQSLQDALIATDRLFQIMHLEPEAECENHTEIPDHLNLSGEIRFEDILFRYGNGKEVLKGLSLCIPKGKITAIVGESGTGKSTLFSLLLKIYQPQKGRITINENDLNTLRTEIVRKRIGIVPQQIELFSGSLADNIAPGCENKDISCLYKILDFCHMTRMMDRFPQGLDTPVGEQGARLSLGEKQRIAIARALYPDPDILLLDEATSALDSLSEEEVRLWMRELSARGKTILVIAHRFSTIKDADQIVVLQDGRISESGTHASLSALHGKYYELWRQSIDFIQEGTF